jgi:hypothetical protein
MILLLYLVYSQIWLILFFSRLSAFSYLHHQTGIEKKRKENKEEWLES